jgi:hypothetical protein
MEKYAVASEAKLWLSSSSSALQPMVNVGLLYDFLPSTPILCRCLPILAPRPSCVFLHSIYPSELCMAPSFLPSQITSYNFFWCLVIHPDVSCPPSRSHYVRDDWSLINGIQFHVVSPSPPSTFICWTDYSVKDLSNPSIMHVSFLTFIVRAFKYP